MRTFLNTYDNEDGAKEAAQKRANEHRRTFHVMRDFGKYLAVPSRSEPGYACQGAFVCSVEPERYCAN